jgi:hypothetical protein
VNRPDIRFTESGGGSDRAIGHARPVLHRQQFALTIGQLLQQRSEAFAIRVAHGLILRRARGCHVRRLLESDEWPPRPNMIGRDIPRNAEKPRRKRSQIAAIPMARPPRLLERSCRQILSVCGHPKPIPEEVVDARKLIGVDRVPVGLRSRDPPRQPARHRLFDGHLKEIYGAGAEVSHH